MVESSKKPALGLIAFIVFIDMAGIGLIVPVMPRLIMELSGEGIDRAAELAVGCCSLTPSCSLCFHRLSAVCPTDSDGGRYC
jgi:DHA1 family tetracycline resistance protein-like MFS transporter